MDRGTGRGKLQRVAAVALVLLAYFALRGLGGPPADDAIEVVPSDAYVYLHVNLDSDSGQYKAASKLAERFPNFPLLVQTAMDRLGGESRTRVDFDEDVKPWLGDEAAFALIPSRGIVAGSAILIEVADKGKANRFFDQISGRPTRSDYRGAQLRAYTPDLVTAFAREFLIVGQAASVKRVIDVGAGRARSLAADKTATEARKPLPDERVLDAYASRDGVRRLLALQGGLVGQLASALDHPALRGAAAAAVARDKRLELVVRTSLDRERNRRRQAFGSFPAFRPSLAGEVPENALVYLGFANLQRTFERLIDQARATIPPLAAAIDSFSQNLDRRGQVDLRKALLPLVRGETALSIVPGIPLPVITLVAKGVDERRAKRVLAKLQGPLARAVDPRRGRQAATFEARKIAGVAARSIRISPAINLTYAVFDGKMVVSSDPKGIRQAREAESSLAGSDLYDSALAALPKRVSSVLFLNLDQLLGIAERTGLGEDPAYAQVRDDLRRLKALGVATTGGEDHFKAQISVAIR